MGNIILHNENSTIGKFAKHIDINNMESINDFTVNAPCNITAYDQVGGPRKVIMGLASKRGPWSRTNHEKVVLQYGFWSAVMLGFTTVQL